MLNTIRSIPLISICCKGIKRFVLIVLRDSKHNSQLDYLGGACAPPFCAVQRLSAPLNASSACWKTLSIRRREVLKGFGRREPERYDAE